MRVLLGLVGIGLGVFGVLVLPENPWAIIVWALVGVVVHDFVFAPLCVAAGWAGRALIPARWRSPVAVAAMCSVVLVVLAVPVYGRPGMRPDNLTVLDRDYPLGLCMALAVVWLCVPVYAHLPVRQDEVVEQQRADDVDPQPPAV